MQQRRVEQRNQSYRLPMHPATFRRVGIVKVNSADYGALAGRLVWVWCWLGVLVAGCTPARSGAAHLTATPTFALLSWSPLPYLSGAARTPTPHGFRLFGLTPTALVQAWSDLLAMSAPVCMETGLGELWCIGTITNLDELPLHNVVVEITMNAPDGAICASSQTPIAYLVIFPRERSPYGTRLMIGAGRECHASARVISAARYPDDYHDVPVQTHPSGTIKATPRAVLRRYITEIAAIQTNDSQTNDSQLNAINIQGRFYWPYAASNTARLTVAIYTEDGQLLNFRQETLHNYNANITPRIASTYSASTSVPDQPDSPFSFWVTLPRAYNMIAPASLQIEAIAEPVL